ncbi:ice-binding family protein [Paraglaciecola psychrophila]|uniref:DUF3494 domain-containing protein n=1 Tax=Paraglaciecola psychrophila 170 TaxID=1129794 RepID=K7AA14_9ALTE|nr:ice-binding family protein [Paraglaciecola psychrophila]AGH46525.1 hypothetical protein C427_4423 [Paraglaciecola psychrophila 170]GAC39147.1 hypothetical protein GPSY_3536 [Paraglaciecola psychrophila 170]
MNKYERFFKPTKKQLTPCMLGITALFAVSSHANDVEPKLSDIAILSSTAAVTCTNSTIIGDAASQVSITKTNCHHAGDEFIPVTDQVISEFRDKRYELEALYCEETLTSLAGKTLGPGVYCFDAASTTTNGVLTLDLDLDSNSLDVTDQWVFKIGSDTGALTGTDFVVNMANGGEACNVNWWVAEAATITRGDFKGNIYAGEAITITGLGPTSPFHGRALANAGVTLTNSAFTGCAGEPATPDTDEDTSGGVCLVENDVVYVKYNIEYIDEELEDVITTAVIAYLVPGEGEESDEWYKYEYDYGFGDYENINDWYYGAQLEVTRKDAMSVYTSRDKSENGNGDRLSEFHIDLSKGVVNNCEFYQGKSECVRSDIIDSSAGLPQELNYWIK